MKHDNITKCIAWITICIAVLAGLYWTKNLRHAYGRSGSYYLYEV